MSKRFAREAQPLDVGSARIRPGNDETIFASSHGNRVDIGTTAFDNHPFRTVSAPLTKWRPATA
jgi:hypothetical protein